MTTLISSKVTAELQEDLIEKLLDLAFLEDFGASNSEQPLDLTTAATVDAKRTGQAEILLKESGVIAGLPFLARVMERLAEQRNTKGESRKVEIELLEEDGTFLEVKGTHTVARLEGSAQTILMGERLALNIMQRLSGIATQTRLYTEIAKPAGIAILDTRKTTPGMRVLERYGVRAGGGVNHRFGLFDAILIKDNHIKIAGGVGQALRMAQKYVQDHFDLKMSQGMIVEISTLEELEIALDLGAERVLLDNMAPDMVRKSIDCIYAKGANRYVEISGGVNLNNLSSYLIDGVNAISTGALTHSAKNIDLSLEFLDQ